RSEHRAGAGGRSLGDLEVEVLLGGEPGCGGAAGNPHLQFVAVADAAADLFEQLPPGDAVGQLVVAGAVDVPGQGDHERARVLGMAQALVPVDPVHEDVRQVR